jgi:hypothetical protein
MVQRHLSEEEVSYVIQHGSHARAISQRAGARAYFLTKHNIPQQDRSNHRIQQIVHTIVLVDEREEEILTVYRNKNGLKDHRRKQKYRTA